MPPALLRRRGERVGGGGTRGGAKAFKSPGGSEAKKIHFSAPCSNSMARPNVPSVTQHPCTADVIASATMAACKARQKVFSAHPEQFEEVSRDNPFAALFTTTSNK